MDHISDKLDNYLSRCLDREFSFGQFDCALFVGEWADVIAGTCLAIAVRGKYTCPDSGRNVTGGNVTAYAMRVLNGAGFAPTDLPKVGDIAFLHGNGFGIVANIYGRTAVVTPSERRGLVYLPELTIRRAISWNSS